MNDLVTIIVPAYNAESTIKRCVESLLKQIYRNIQVIVVNDGSSDNTERILNEFHDERLLILNQVNKGVSSARNVALENAKGDFIAFCDADDFYQEDYLSWMLPLFRKNICMVSCDYTSKTTQIKNAKPKIKEFSCKEALRELFSDKFQFVYLWNKIFRKEYLKDLRFDEKIKNFGEDLLFCYHYLRQCPKDSLAVHINMKLYHYIKHASGVSAIKKTTSFPNFKLNFLNALDKIASAEKLAGEEILAKRINSWQFLIIVQYLYESRKIKDLHRALKNKAKLLYEDYKQFRHTYKNFRKLGFVYRFL